MKLELIEAKPDRRAYPHPLLFVHPLGHAAWYWEENFLRYFAAQGFHCFAMSLRGHGQSEGKDHLRWASTKDYLADIAAAAAQLPARAVLVGDSLGGMLVRKYLEKNAPPAAVLLSPASQRGAWHFSLKVLRKHPLLFLQLNTTFHVKPLYSTPQLYREVFCGDQLPEGLVKKYQSKTDNDSYRMYTELLLGLAEPKRYAAQTPVLLLTGSEDRTFPKSSYDKIETQLGAKRVELPGLPHEMALDTHWQLAADSIIQWLFTLKQ
jgi:pimeloyl-ACP methyl ester carboxylesterase